MSQQSTPFPPQQRYYAPTAATSTAQSQFTGVPQQHQPAMQQPTYTYVTAPQQQPLLYPQQQPAMQYVLVSEQPQATLNQPQYVSHLAPAGVVQAGQLQHPQQIMMMAPIQATAATVPTPLASEIQQLQLQHQEELSEIHLALLHQQQLQHHQNAAYRSSDLCCFFLQGICKYGARCRFLHRDVVGKMCQFKESCPVGHADRGGKIPRQARAKLEQQNTP